MRVDVRGRGLEERTRGRWDRPPVVQLARLLLGQGVAERVVELLLGQRDRRVDVARGFQRREPGAERGDRQWEYTLDRRGVDTNRSGRVPVADRFLGEKPAEGVPDHDGLRREIRNDLRTVVGHRVNPVVSYSIRLGAGLLDGVRGRRASRARSRRTPPR
jgi:hypothetical protein